MAERSYYEILGVRRGADADEIREAWRRVARSAHPDRNPDDPLAAEAFKQAAEAWATLRDPAARRRYDLGGVGPPGARHADRQPTVGTVLRRVASAASRSLRARRGDDLVVEVTITVEEALDGIARVLSLPRARNPGADVPEIVMRQLRFDLPPGVRDGQQLRWRREGAPGVWGGAPGDLLIDVRHEEHPFLRFLASGHLEARLPLRLGEWVSGGTFRVPVGGRVVRVLVPAEHPRGEPVVVAGQGIPDGDGGRGPLEVRLEVEVPSGPFTPEALDALRRFEAELARADRSTVWHESMARLSALDES
ncbi:MAG: J domain-containing protein [Deltaproteobacteria bacterium]|nr:MAG: J domain-containing protein [Deltaproteobacteria bacterium]